MQAKHEMKGTRKVLTAGESFNERKDFLWSYIHTCQDLIKAIQATSIGTSSLAYEVIRMEREQIQQTYDELKQLQRWFKTSGLKPDEPFSYKREGSNEQNK